MLFNLLYSGVNLLLVLVLFVGSFAIIHNLTKALK